MPNVASLSLPYYYLSIFLYAKYNTCVRVSGQNLFCVVDRFQILIIFGIKIFYWHKKTIFFVPSLLDQIKNVVINPFSELVMDTSWQ